MSYKLCTRCQFVVSSQALACTTCGCTTFESTDAPREHGDEPAVMAMRPHVRHESKRPDLREKVTGEVRKLAVGTHRSRVLL